LTALHVPTHPHVGPVDPVGDAARGGALLKSKQLDLLPTQVTVERRGEPIISHPFGREPRVPSVPSSPRSDVVSVAVMEDVPELVES